MLEARILYREKGTCSRVVVTCQNFSMCKLTNKGNDIISFTGYREIAFNKIDFLKKKWDGFCIHVCFPSQLQNFPGKEHPLLSVSSRQERLVQRHLGQFDIEF